MVVLRGPSRAEVMRELNREVSPSFFHLCARTGRFPVRLTGT